MLVTLPRSLAALPQLAAKGEQVRFGLTNCVLVEDQGNGLYRVTVTDGRRAAVAQGPFDEPKLADPEPSVTEAFVPAEAWKEAFKGPGDDVHVLADSRSIRLVSGPRIINADTPPKESRFPNVLQIFPRKRPKVSFLIDPKLLDELLRSVLPLTNDEKRAVSLCYYGDGQPVGLAYNWAGHTLDSLIVPLVATK